MKEEDTPYAQDKSDNVEGLKRNLREAIGEKKREQEKRRAAEEKLKSYEGFDIEAARTAQERPRCMRYPRPRGRA